MSKGNAAPARWLLCGYSGQGPDIVLAELSSDGCFAALDAMRCGLNPSCACAGGPGRFYVGCELADRAAVLALREENGRLRQAAMWPAPGAGLCHLLYTSKGVFGCCYASGDVFLLSMDGTLLWHARPADARHAHWGALAPDRQTFFWTDLGADCLYSVPLHGGLPAGDPRKIPLFGGAGPRQLLFFDGERMAVICEKGNAVVLLKRDGGRWQAVQSIPSTGRSGDNYPGGACFLAPDTLLVGNRGADTLAAFRCRAGVLRREWEQPLPGRWPRWLTVRGKVVMAACQKSDAVLTLRKEAGKVRLLGSLRLEGASCAIADDTGEKERFG